MYLRYWKRGWWSILLQFCQNVAGALILAPTVLIFQENSTAQGLLFLVVGLLLVVPILGWLFEMFAKSSERIENK